MLTLRITAKVAKLLQATLDSGPSTSMGLLGDWYANLLILHRQHLLLAVSERTLLPVVMPARDLKVFPLRLSHDLEALLRALGIPAEKIGLEVAEMGEWRLAKTASRKILGSMNDFANMLEAYMDDDAPLLKQSLRLAKSPCGPLGMVSPMEATATLFGVKVPDEI